MSGDTTSGELNSAGVHSQTAILRLHVAFSYVFRSRHEKSRSWDLLAPYPPPRSPNNTPPSCTSPTNTFRWHVWRACHGCIVSNAWDPQQICDRTTQTIAARKQHAHVWIEKNESVRGDRPDLNETRAFMRPRANASVQCCHPPRLVITSEEQKNETSSDAGNTAGTFHSYLCLLCGSTKDFV